MVMVVERLVMSLQLLMFCNGSDSVHDGVGWGVGGGAGRSREKGRDEIIVMMTPMMMMRLMVTVRMTTMMMRLMVTVRMIHEVFQGGRWSC